MYCSVAGGGKVRGRRGKSGWKAGGEAGGKAGGGESGGGGKREGRRGVVGVGRGQRPSQ